jgi:predicted outer membrane protein
MMKRVARTLAAVAGALAVAASAAMAQSSDQRIPLRKGELPPPSSTTSTTTTTTMDTINRPTTYTSGGDVMTDFTGWTDGNVLAHMIAGDSLEIELANLALARSTNTQVQDIARQLLQDHTASLTKEREMATSENIPPVAHPGDRSDDHLIMAYNELRNLSGVDFDRAWVRHQIMHHANHLKMVDALEEVAKDNDLEDWVEESYTPVRGHLERLNAVAPSLGVTPGVITPKQ